MDRRAAFTLSNGQDAQAQNLKFQGLTASSACTDGETACVGGQLGQCVGGKFATSSCAATLQCLALPLVNKAGTSVTCDTLEDAQARIAATGATGGLTGSPVGQRAELGRRAEFTLNNGQEAQALNLKFQTLTASSPCTAGETSCVNDEIAQCVNGEFAVSACAATLKCVALPLVNKAGTSVTCDTPEDAEARIAATGAVGGLTGSPAAKRAGLGRRAAFTLSNGKAAQALNAKFDTLTASSPCTAGETACVGGDLGQCVGGKFAISPCAATLKCFALPLVNKAGTSVACDTPEDAAARISATGATGGLTGKREIAEPAIWSRDVTAPPACAAKQTKRAYTTGALVKRIAQTDLVQVATSWQTLCEQSGGNRNGAGGGPCVVLAGGKGLSALLANADACAQQDNADAMVDFAKSAGVTNKDALVANAVAYRKHPRNALNIGGDTPSTPFCERAPRNAELNGVVNAQLAGVDPGLFGSPSFPIVAFGASGTCPFGQTADVATCSCK
jgi:hypothetical protein